QERDDHQEQKVEEDEDVVDPAEPAEHFVVVDPDRPDVHERNQIAEEERPFASQLMAEAAALSTLAELQYKECDRDREDAVAEALDAGRVEAVCLVIGRSCADALRLPRPRRDKHAKPEDSLTSRTRSRLEPGRSWRVTAQK